MEVVGIPSERLERVRARYESGERDFANTYLGERGVVNVNDYGNGSAILIAYGEPTPELVPEVMDRAREIGARRMGLRITGPTDAFQRALLLAGWLDMGERVEFKTPVEKLPTEDGTPMSWREAGDDAAPLLARAAEGDPHGRDVRDEPAALLREGDRVAIGDDVAVVCTRVDPKDGWCTIAYLGLVPEARGKGLGKWVHRHGFAMMRAQGGKLYHGGTATSNKAMIALFKAHGCREFKRMTEFEWHAPRAAPDPPSGRCSAPTRAGTRPSTGRRGFARRCGARRAVEA
jgi:GNAT superfamily N-acetyltransferase